MLMLNVIYAECRYAECQGAEMFAFMDKLALKGQNCGQVLNSRIARFNA